MPHNKSIHIPINYLETCVKRMHVYDNVNELNICAKNSLSYIKYYNLAQNNIPLTDSKLTNKKI